MNVSDTEYMDKLMKDVFIPMPMGGARPLDKTKSSYEKFVQTVKDIIDSGKDRVHGFELLFSNNYDKVYKNKIDIYCIDAIELIKKIGELREQSIAQMKKNMETTNFIGPDRVAHVNKTEGILEGINKTTKIILDSLKSTSDEQGK